MPGGRIYLVERFYSTYEELKHLSIPDFEKIRLSFYSTYEELKPILCSK